MSIFKPTKPSKRSNSDNWYYVKRISKSHDAVLSTIKYRCEFPAYPRLKAHTIDQHFKSVVFFSLQTSDDIIASKKCNLADKAYMEFCDALERGSVKPSDAQIREWAQAVYAFYKDHYPDNTGLPSEGKTLEALLNLEYSQAKLIHPILKKRHKDTAYWEINENPFQIVHSPTDYSESAVEYRVGTLTNWWMHNTIDRLGYDDRLRLVAEVDKIARYAVLGIHQTDPSSNIPKGTTVEPEIKGKGSSTFSSILEAWKDTQDKYETIRKREAAIRRLKAFIGHDNANAVTLEQANRWRNSLKNKLSANTIKNDLVAGVKSIFSFAFDQGYIESNRLERFKGVKAAGKKADGIPYTDIEVIEIVAAARNEPDLRVKYIVLMLVATGARISELTQLGYD